MRRAMLIVLDFVFDHVSGTSKFVYTCPILHSSKRENFFQWDPLAAVGGQQVVDAIALRLSPIGHLPLSVFPIRCAPPAFDEERVVLELPFLAPLFARKLAPGLLLERVVVKLLQADVGELVQSRGERSSIGVSLAPRTQPSR